MSRVTGKDKRCDDGDMASANPKNDFDADNDGWMPYGYDAAFLTYAEFMDTVDMTKMANLGASSQNILTKPVHSKSVTATTQTASMGVRYGGH